VKSGENIVYHVTAKKENYRSNIVAKCYGTACGESKPENESAETRRSISVNKHRSVAAAAASQWRMTACSGMARND